MTSTPPTDPDGSAVFHVISSPRDEVTPTDMYNATQGVRNMSGQNVIAQLGAKIDAQTADTRAQIAAQNAKIDAVAAAQNAKIDAATAAQNAKIDTATAAQNAKIDVLNTEIRSLHTELRTLRWMFAGMLTLLGILTAGFVTVAVRAFAETAPPAAIAVQAASAEDPSGAPSQAIPPIEPPSEESTGSPTE